MAPSVGRNSSLTTLSLLSLTVLAIWQSPYPLCVQLLCLIEGCSQFVNLFGIITINSIGSYFPRSTTTGFTVKKTPPGWYSLQFQFLAVSLGYSWDSWPMSRKFLSSVFVVRLRKILWESLANYMYFKKLQSISSCWVVWVVLTWWHCDICVQLLWAGCSHRFPFLGIALCWQIDENLTRTVLDHSIHSQTVLSVVGTTTYDYINLLCC